MKSALMKVTMLATALCALPTVAMAEGWKQLAADGLRHFVVVDPTATEPVFREAATAVCAAGKPCLVLYWNDESKAAARMPMSRAQSQAMVAQVRRNPATGMDELLTRCTGGVATERCLK